MIPEHFTRLTELDEAWRISPAGVRLEAIRKSALALRDHIGAAGRVKQVRTGDLITLPYPASFGLGSAARSLLPYLMITNRMMVLTLQTSDGPKRLVVNPSDHERDAYTPFFKRLADKMPDFVNNLVARRHSEVPRRLDELGLRGDQVDYITYDHLHTQDLRRVMLEWCPRAKLIVQREEIAIYERLHPLQNDWYIADAVRGIPTDRFIVLDGDYLLGEGVALVRTPGHTLGNHSIVFNTDRGIWAVSENGVAPDNYVPERSDISGLAAHARATGVEVILNANTREHSLDQYTSMILEKTLVDPCSDGSGFVQVFNSSELTAHALLPGLAPSYAHRAITVG
jgi:hypothetical protein